MMASQVRVWFGRGVSNHPGLYDWIRSSAYASGWTLLASHIEPHAPCLRTADESWVEAVCDSKEAYVAQCLESCRIHQVDVFVPGRNFVELSDARPAFEAIGVRLVLAADSKTLDLVDDKASFTAHMLQSEVHGPTSKSYKNLSEFDQAWESMQGHYDKLCSKPSRGIFAQGFRVIYPELDAYQELMAGSLFRISLPHFREALSQRDEFDAQLLMEFLPGEEYSVDCFRSQSGEVAIVPRCKKGSGYVQYVSRAPDVERAARIVAEYLDLRACFNVQLRADSQGILKVLEVNPRLSGGVAMAAHTGICLPALAIAECLGEELQWSHEDFDYAIMRSEIFQKVLI
jgi:hypothetical protein